MPSRIEDYALIGDCETAALVSREGSIDWLCWPNFSSAACFAAILGTPENGRWSVAPAGNYHSERRYSDATLILETRFDTDDGSATLIDFMPPRGTNSDVVRLVRGDRGAVPMRTEMVLRFDNGRSVPWVTKVENGDLRAVSGPDMVVLRSPIELKGENLRSVADFTVQAGQTVPFVLTYGESYKPMPKPVDWEQALKDTEEFWRTWISRARCEGEYTIYMERSLMTLKALTYSPTGGIVAAPTTSLPEMPGGPRNWDYRYCWLRDATFTLLALMHGGFQDEARDWRDWLLRAAAGSPDQIQIMYGIRGERNLMEWEADWLPGYQGSKPVRIGNAASSQLQLDVYGEVADALLHAHLSGIEPRQGDLDLLSELTSHLEQIWQQPDSGIWEVRGGPRQFTYSKVMAWVAFDRTIKNAEKFRLKGPVERWRQLRDAVHEEVCREAWNPQLRSFTQSYGSKELDSSLLLMPLVGFLPPSDPRVVSTVDAIQKNLTRDGLLMRYNTSSAGDGLPPGEGAFLACTFWLVNVLCLLGRHDEAREKFEQLLQLCNDVGLLSEEYDTKQKRFLGNFPQALSHIALVNAGFEFTQGSKPAHRRSGSGHAKSPREVSL